jgi:hypothetical protein
MANLVQQWADQDLRSAYVWTLGQPAGDGRTAMLSRVALVWSKTAPAEAAEIVVNQMPPGPQQTEAVMSVLHQWALRDPGATIKWVERFPPGPLRERAITELEGLVQPDRALPPRP